MKFLKKVIYLLICILVIICFTFGSLSKDTVLKVYNNIIQTAGNLVLTSDISLKGDRKYGTDHYTGTYSAEYKNFSGTEYIFGGTSVDRDAGNEITIFCSLEITGGTAEVFLQSGSYEPVTLLETTGIYSEAVILPEGGNYIGIKGDSFTGNIELSIE